MNMNKKLIPLATASTIAVSLLTANTPLFAETGANQTASQALVFNHVNVVDVENSTVLQDMMVVVQNEKISNMGHSGEFETPANARVIETKDQYLIPGL